MMDHRVDLIPENLWSKKCPHKLRPAYITVHNTSNSASAKNEVAYVERNTACTFCHIFVDEKEAIQCLPLDRNGWHAGDGANNRAALLDTQTIKLFFNKRGKGNRQRSK